MCADHTYRGTPVRQVARADLQDCLDDGVQLLGGSDGYSEDWKYWVCLRIQVEFIIRALLGETH